MVLGIKYYILISRSELDTLFVNYAFMQMFYEPVLISLLVIGTCFQKIITCYFELFNIIKLSKDKQNTLSNLLIIPKITSDIFGKPIQSLISLSYIFLTDDYNDS